MAGTMAHARRALELVGGGSFRAWSHVLDLRRLDRRGFGCSAALVCRWHGQSGGLGTSDVLGGAITLADIRITQGRLREAMSTYERGLRIATEHAAPALRGAADMHVGMSRICYERNELDAAMQHLLTSSELGEHAGLPPNRYRWRVAMARYGRLKEIWAALSTCSTRRTACM